jgi:hypothetical protein
MEARQGAIRILSGGGCGSADDLRRRTGTGGRHHLMRDLENHRSAP